MLSEAALEQTAAQLADFRLATSQQHDTLSQILEQYGTLMQDYRRLKSDYEEERDSRERYKQMARGQERNPFVLVLIDGDGYVFDDDLVSNGAEGGQRAAQLLSDAVKRSMRKRGLDQCRIMVRVYANLVGLSKTLAKANLTGKEKRSLAPFTANFTRSNDLFDFVDAGELEENADFKIRAMFRQFVENAQCKHTYFAGCHNVGYLNELTPYLSNRDRITLVRTPAFHPQFSKLGLHIEDFPGIFRTTPLNGELPIMQKPVPLPPKIVPVQQPTSAAASTAGNAEVCFFFQKGNCRYGKTCRNLHVKSTANGHTGKAAGNLSDTKNRREDTSNSKSSFQLSKSDNDFMNGHAGVTTNGINGTTAADSVQNQIDFATSLPQAVNIPPNQIPVNNDDHRLDPYVQPPSAADYDDFKARTSKQKLCNNYHVNGYCAQGDTCTYDHSPVSQGVLNALQQIIFSNPCPRKGNCRRTNCLYGHICQWAECGHRGGKGHCKFSRFMHGQDFNVAQYMDGEAPPTRREAQANFVENGSGARSAPAEGSVSGADLAAPTKNGGASVRDFMPPPVQETAPDRERIRPMTNGSAGSWTSTRPIEQDGTSGWDSARPTTQASASGWDSVRPTAQADASGWDSVRPTMQGGEWNSMRPTAQSSEWQTESDGDAENAGNEGALLDFGHDNELD